MHAWMCVCTVYVLSLNLKIKNSYTSKRSNSSKPVHFVLLPKMKQHTLHELQTIAKHRKKERKKKKQQGTVNYTVKEK